MTRFCHIRWVCWTDCHLLGQSFKSKFKYINSAPPLKMSPWAPLHQILHMILCIQGPLYLLASPCTYCAPECHTKSRIQLETQKGPFGVRGVAWGGVLVIGCLRREQLHCEWSEHGGGGWLPGPVNLTQPDLRTGQGSPPPIQLGKKAPFDPGRCPHQARSRPCWA